MRDTARANELVRSHALGLPSNGRAMPIISTERR
jgi:hypothetical protein